MERDRNNGKRTGDENGDEAYAKGFRLRSPSYAEQDGMAGENGGRVKASTIPLVAAT